MGKQAYAYVDWRKIETVREALKKGSINTVSELTGRDARQRKTLMALTPEERAKLVKLDDKLASEVGIAAAFLCHEGKAADGIGLFDLVVRAGHDILDLSAGSYLDTSVALDATYWLLTAPAELKTSERGRLYSDYFRPCAQRNTALLLNLAEIARDLLKDNQAAIALLREAIELGDPTIRKSLEADKADWEKVAGFDTLASVMPKIPVGLRAFQLWDDRGESTEWPGIFSFEIPFCEEADVSEWLHGVDEASFEVFGRSPEADRWALWRRDRNAPREESPVVLFSRKGNIAVYAASVAGMMRLSTCKWTVKDALAIGYPYGDDGWTPPAKLAKLTPIKERVALLEPVVPETMKLDPEEERAKALALMPEFIAEATRRGKTSSVRKPGESAPAKKQPVTKFDVGLAKVPETEWPADIAFLQSKGGKPWLKTFDVRLLKAKALPELLEDWDREENNPDVKANQRALGEVLAMITFVIEAPEDNATIYGYWRGPEKTPLSSAPIVSFDSEGTISKETGSLIDVLLQKGCYEEPEQFAEWKTKLKQAGVAITAKKWDDYRSRATWASDPEKIHDELYEKYRRELGAK